MKKTLDERIFDVINIVIMSLFGFLTIYPFIYILAISLNDASDSMKGGIYFFPRIFTLYNFEFVFKDPELFRAFLNSLLRTTVGTFSSVLCTSMLAFSFTQKKMPGYRIFYTIFIVSMFVSGGLIPTFMLFRWIGIYDSFLVYLLPSLVGVYNMILMRTFFSQIPASLQESAYIDGANEFQIFLRIILPLSKPILATIGLFVAVYQWNSWADTLFFTTGRIELKTLQYKLMEIIRQSQAAAAVAKNPKLQKLNRLGIRSVNPESIKMAITIVATVPILVVYPFLQKYFVSGVMIGAVKE